ncbi:tyrosine-type recombinase/integrase [Rhizobium sp. Root482]|uniref:tyrosine-type recombinase/integrase n=1 Tax=Rhizobium sp. Root482 TaxID=1736543 RepID=UPI0006FCBEBA|nr:tyrosine-type recombinase/integrase [Rhizobium sp. Root482]KQY14406.1 hypothetical protein ASD31_09055 [Rhizobium sp. Root482]
MKAATEKAKTPKYLFKRGNQYTYIRNIPPRHRHLFENRRQVSKSLGPDFTQAVIDLETCKRDHEAALAGNGKVKTVSYDEQLERAEQFGITSKSSAQIRLDTMEQQMAEMAQRIRIAYFIDNPTHLDAVTIIGATKEPALLIMKAFEIYQELDHQFTLNLREWDAKQKIKRYENAMKDFIARCGDIDVLTIDETIAETYVNSLWTDVLDASKKFGSDHANRRITQVRKVLKLVLDKRYKRKFTALDGHSIKLKVSDAGKRLPFTEAEVRAIYAALPTADMSDQAKAMIQIALITGCGPKELCWITKEDLRLDAKTPFMKIGPNRLRAQVKSGEDRHRDLPIATDEGVKLLKQFPDGFTLYQGDRGPSILNGELSPFFQAVTPGKSFYSARHRLDDLIKTANIDLGIKAAISGHSLGGRLLYYGKSGNGYTLKDKKEALVKALAAAPKKEEHENEQLNINP